MYIYIYTVVGTLLDALAPRIADTQQAIAVAALCAIGAIGAGRLPPPPKHLDIFI